MIKVKLADGAKVPAYATPGSACFDIYATDVKLLYDNVFEYSTSLFFEIPEGHALMIYSRSSAGFKHQTRLSNCVGVIDSDYRGELKVQLFEDVVLYDGEAISFPHADLSKAVAQGMIIPVNQVQFEVVDTLSETQRNTGGFGSTDNQHEKK